MRKIDVWSTGYRGDIVQRPLVEALLARPDVEQRIVYCGQTPSLELMRALPVPQCTSAGSNRMAAVPAMLPQIWQARKNLAAFYTNDTGKRIVHITMESLWDHFYIDLPKRAGATILLVVHDAQPHLGEENWLLSRMQERLMRQADHLAVLSPYAGDVLAKRIGTAIPIHVVSPGLVMNSAPPGPAKLAPVDRPMRFLFFGRIHHYKGLDILLEAWALFRARQDAPQASLSIVGSANIDPYRKQIDDAVDVTLEHGWISDERMAEVFAEHDVNVLPYREGSESATALAGMWAGMPSVATDIGCFREKLVNGESALLTAIDASALADAIYRISTEAGLYSKLAQGTHLSARQWDSSAVAKNWITLYEQISKSPRPR
jgi:glycosyltransferase involved in cell wall biosynthesis